MSIFSVNANTLSNQNVIQVWIFIPWCKCSYDAHVSLPICGCKFSWCKCFLQRCKCSYDAHVSLPICGYKFPWCKCPIMEMQMRLLYDANFSCRDVNAKFIYDDGNAPLRRCRCKSLFFWYKNASCGYDMTQMLFFLTQMQFNQKFLLFSQIKAS